MLSHSSDLLQIDLSAAIVRDPLLLSPDTRVMDAIAQMGKIRTCYLTTGGTDGPTNKEIEARSSCIFVVEDSKLLGVLTDRAIVQLVSEQLRLEDLTLRQVTPPTVVSLKQSTPMTVGSALQLLHQYGIENLPILDDQAYPVGLVTCTSLQAAIVLHASQRVIEQPTQAAPPPAQQEIDGFPILVQRLAEALHVSCAWVTEQIGELLPGLVADGAQETWQPTVSYPEAVEKLLQEREARYRAVMDYASDAILLANSYGYLIEVNRKAEELLGYSREELSRIHVSQIHPPEVLKAVQKHFSSIISNKPGYTLETLVLCKDGSQIPVDITGSRIDLDGEQIIQGIFRDVRDRKRAEAALAASEAFNRQLVKEFPIGLAQCRMDGHLVYVNLAFSEILGRTIEETLSLSYWDITPIQYADQEAEQLQSLRHHGRYGPYEKEYIHRDGHLVPVLLTGLMMTQDGEEFIWSSVQDISDRKRAENALRESQQFLQTVLDTFPLSIFWKDRNSVYLGCNRNFLQDAGFFSVTEVIGKTDYDMPWGDAEADVYRADDQEVIQSNIAKLNINETLKCANGHQTWIETNKLPLHNIKGEVIGVLGTYQNISIRKQVELDLQASEARFRRMFDSNVVGMIFADFQGNILDANDRFLQMIGYTREELNTESLRWDQLTPPEHVPADVVAIEQLIHYGGIEPWEKEYYRKDGSRVPVLIGAAFLPGSQDQTICVVIDISDRKQAEQIIRLQAEREVLLREITQRIRQSLDLSEILAAVTYQVKELLQGDQVIILRLLPDGGGQVVEEAVSEGLPSLKNHRCNDEVWSQDILNDYWQGQPRIVADVSNDVWTDCLISCSKTGQNCSKIVAPILQDIRQNEQHYQIDPKANNKLWGLLVICACREQRVWREDEAQLLQQIANQLAIAIQQSSLFKQLQQELAERQQTEEQLIQSNHELALSNQELARATRLKDEFLANMSHELRTPLNAILGMTEGLQEEIFGSVSDRQSKSLKTIERSASHLLCLINDILDVAKISSGQIELELTSIAVVPLCSSSLAFIKQQALKRQIQLETHFPSPLPNLLGDERRIRQALLNLLANAVKFTPEGGKITLAVSLVEPYIAPRKFLRIAVMDTGIGIAADNINQLFQPFVQIDSALNRQYTGTGLGLALVKQIVELHGGQVGLTSELGVGSCFTIDLPCASETMTMPAPELGGTRQYSVTNTYAILSDDSTPAPLILLAEDNEANISTVTNYLEAKGYRVVLANNGQEAIVQAQTKQPDLILMDIQMSGMDGLEAMQQIRRDPNLIQVPIIAMTALAMTGDRERCFAAGANEYLTKPVKLKHLVAIIHNFLSFKFHASEG